MTIGFGGNERVDYLTYDTKEIWCCYEIKVSKGDFHSKAKKTFLGHYNYYVMSQELYEEVKEEVPKEIGIYVYDEEKDYIRLIKNSKKQELKVSDEILKNSMIRSLSRENEKYIKCCDKDYVEKIKNENKKLRKESKENYNDYIKLQHAIRFACDKCGVNFKEVRDFIYKKL